MWIWKRIWRTITTRFKFKIIGGLFAIILLAFSIAGIYTYYSYQKLLTQELSKQSAIANQEAFAKLELKVQEMKRISQMIVFSSEIEAMIQRYNQYKDTDAFQLYLEKQNIDDLINQLRTDAPYITGLYMLDLSGENIYYRYNTPAINDLNRYSFDPIRLNLRETSGELIWMRMSLPSDIEPDGYRDTIVASRWMKNNKLNKYGLLIMTIDESFLSGGLEELSNHGTDKVYLFNQSRELLYSNHHLTTERQLVDLLSHTSSQIMNEEIFSRNESLYPLDDSFILISLKSMDKIKRENQRIAQNIMISGLIIAIASSALSILMLNKMLRPLADLMKGLQRLRSGKFETRIKVRTNDELAYIGESFNAMTEHVEGLIKEVYVTQLNEREAELKALQAQLNPHFLHNFFNEIYWKLHLQGEKQTAHLIGAVSEMLKHSLMPIRKPTTVKEELKQIKNYVTIQEELFESDFEFILEVDENVMDYEIMRSLLQPLVENVFVHAFRNMLTHKILKISFAEQNGLLRIDITDNGCGIDQSMITKLLDSTDLLSEHAVRESIGVRNVVRRIELLHGEPYCLQIYSQLEHGTTMSLFLPTTMEKSVDLSFPV